jgi:hypothetical protein
VWKEPWPKEAFQFLTNFRPDAKWYHLFEPNLLVRVNTSDEFVLHRGKWLAQELGFFYQEGDVAKSSPSGSNGKEFQGETKFYGEALDKANTEFLFSSSHLLRVMEISGKRNFRFLRKHIHLFCNQASMNYWQEGWFLMKCAINSFRLGIKYGRR